MRGGTLIIGERKKLEDIYARVKDLRKVLVAGCNGCVAICYAGGEKEVGLLASELRILARKDGRPLEISELAQVRQCEHEFAEAARPEVETADAVICLGCGEGVQIMAEHFPGRVFLPGINTTFIGSPDKQGVWSEKCAACGNCVLDRTGGVCPIARCSKSLLNGPCGGSHDGKCEVRDELPCAWQLIYDRLKDQNRLEELEQVWEPKDWRSSRDGGCRKITREDMVAEKNG
jgi:hypothetical protein